MSDSFKSKNDLRFCILQSAARLFSKLGVDRTSTRDISKDSKANISLISYHFGGKEGLYKEVIREFALKVQEQMNSQIDALSDKEVTRERFIDEIRFIVLNIIRMRKEHPEISVILMREKIEGMPLSKEIHEEIFYPLIQKFFMMFKSAQEKNIVKKEINPAVFFIILTEAIWGFYTIMNCETSLKQECQQFAEDENLLLDQILQTILTGALK